MAKINGFTSLFVNLTNNIKRFIAGIGLINDHANIDDSIKEQATLWITKIEHGLNNADKLAFHHWTKQSDCQRNSLFTIASLNNDKNVLDELGLLLPLDKPLRQNKPLVLQYFIPASIAIIFSSLVYFLFNITTFSNSQNTQQFTESKTLQTAIGQQICFSLPDGSRVKLNTNSLVKVSFSKGERLLTLVRGEAIFDVAKDSSRPFTVTVGENTFTALGTVFNIEKTTNDDVELVVKEGRVLISSLQQPLNKSGDGLATFAKPQANHLKVTAGELANIKYNKQTTKQKISFEQMQQELAWQQGRLVFDGLPLDKALAEISRYTATQFEFTDAEVAKIKVSGYFKANDIEGLLKSLSNNFNIQFKTAKNNVVRLQTKVES